MAQTMLPADHPANKRDRRVELEIKLDWHGQPDSVRVSQPSGHEDFDRSAMRAIADAGKLPPLPPSLREQNVVLYWSFHRDPRGCSPLYARVSARRFTDEEALRRALGVGQLEQASSILARAKDRAPLIQLVAEAGLASREPRLRQLALGLASSERVAATLRDERVPRVWSAAVETLAGRKETTRLLGELERRAAQQPLDERRLGELLQLLAALESLHAQLGEKLLVQLLARPEPPLVLAAAGLASSAALLDAPLEKWKGRPEVSGPLAVRKRSLGSDAACDELIGKILTGEKAAPTLEALRRFPVAAFNAQVEALARNGRVPPRVRVKAVELVGALHLSLVPLYVALAAASPDVQIAAVRALSSMRHKPAIAQRLADLAIRSKGMVAAEALAGLALVGEERFREDVTRRMRHLDAKGQALVAASLWSYGEEAITPLAKLLSHSSSEVRRAAAASLARIPGERARQALAASMAPASAPGAARSPLEALLEQAGSFASASSAPASH